MFYKNKLLKNNKGMTLVELVVSIAIFTLISGITIFNYGDLRSSFSIQNITNDIALSIRKAQSYAIGASGISSSFSYGYGVHFSLDTSPTESSGGERAFAIFSDIYSNKKYDYQNGISCGSLIDSDNECIEMLNITSTDKIVGFYINDTLEETSANSTLDIVFVRPNPDAYFCFTYDNLNSPYCDKDTEVNHVGIVVSGVNKTKVITVWNTGQISIN